jgi:flagellar export protein FliJ
VLRHRRRIEDARALAMRQAVERHETARAQQETLERMTTQARASLGAACTAGLTGAALRLQAESARDLHGRARAAAASAAVEASRVEDRRAELVDAARERRVLERLETMQRATWQADLTRHDQRTTDEIATTRHRRRS